MGCKPVLITDRKLYIGYRLITKSVTSNDLEWHNNRRPVLSLWYTCMPVMWAKQVFFGSIGACVCVCVCMSVQNPHKTIDQKLCISV